MANLGSKEVGVGATYTYASGTNAKFTYANGSGSTLGVGFSTSGTYGSFKASGTVTKLSTTTIDYGTRAGSYVYYSYFNYGRFSEWCYPIGYPETKWIYAYRVKANGFNGGSMIKAAAGPEAPYCNPFYDGTTQTKERTDGMTWEVGANLSSTIGIDLSSKTGYTTTAKLSYTNNSGGVRQICGTNDHVGGTPIRIATRS